MKTHHKCYIALSDKESFIFNSCEKLEQKLGIALKEKQLEEIIEQNYFIKTLYGVFYFDYAL